MAQEQTQPQATQTSQNEGVANPQIAGEDTISDISTPQSNDSTIPTASAPNTPPPPTSAGTEAVGQTLQDKTGSPTPGNAANGPVPGQQQQEPQTNFGKLNPKQAQTQAIKTAPMNTQQQQQVQKASVWHTIAETLAGGPRYTYSVDEFGNMKRDKVPVSTAHLALAVAMEALQGAAIGASQQGPNAAGKAAAAGFAAGQQRVQKQAELDKEQAQSDFKNRMLTTENNMRMYMMARQIGRMDQEANKDYIGQFKPMGDYLMNNYPGFVQGPVGYKDLAKYNVTVDHAIPYLNVPRIDPATGKQVVINGIPQTDNEYLIVKPGLKATGLLQENDVKQLQDMGILPKGAAADLIINTPMQLMQAMSLKSQIAQFGLGKTTYGNFFGRVDNMASGKTPVPKNMATITPAIKDKALDSAADQSADKYNVPPALIKGLIMTESTGNANAPDSKAHVGGGSRGGAIGPMQVMLDTAQQYGVTDPRVLRDPKVNIEIGTRYYSDLLKNPHVDGDPKLAAAAYIGGIGVVTADHKLDLSKKSPENKAAILNYIDKFSKNVGLGINNVAAQAQEQQGATPPQQGTYAGQLNADTRLSLDDWNKMYPSTRKDNEQFLSLLAHTENNYGAALKELETKDQKAAANMMAFLGGPDAIAQHDLSVRIDAQQRQTDEAVRKSEAIQETKRKADEAAQQAKQDMLNTLEAASIPPDVLNMDPKDVISSLQGQGVTIPPEAIRDALSIAKYKEPETIASNKLWFKDKSFNQQDLVDLVHQFNPDYDQKNFKNLAQYSNPNSTIGKTIFAASGVANHLNMLLDAAKEVRDAGTGQTNFPALNRLMNALNYQVGGTGYVKLAALTQAVNGEMGKVLSGGFAPDKEQTEALMKNMTPANAYNQIEQLTKLYTGVMHGKITPFDESYSQMTNGQHMTNIPDSFTRLSRRLGYDTPWKPDPKPPVPGAVAGRDPNTGEVAAWRLPDGRVVQVNAPVNPTSRAENLVNNLRSTNPQEPLGQ